MQFRVTGAHRETGNNVETIVEAINQSAAEKWANEHAILWSEVRSADTINCPACKTLLHATARICGVCGHKVEPSATAAVTSRDVASRSPLPKCPRCGQFMLSEVCAVCSSGHFSAGEIAVFRLRNRDSATQLKLAAGVISVIVLVAIVFSSIHSNRDTAPEPHNSIPSDDRTNSSVLYDNGSTAMATELASRCGEDVETVEAMTWKGQELLRKGGINQSKESILEGMLSLYPSTPRRDTYAKCVALYTTLRQQGNSHHDALMAVKFSLDQTNPD